MDGNDYKSKSSGKPRNKNRRKPKNNGPSLCQCLRDEHCDSGLVDSVGPRTIKFSIFQPQEFKNKHDNYCQGQQFQVPKSLIDEKANDKNVTTPQKMTVTNPTQPTSVKSLHVTEDKSELKNDPFKDDEPQVFKGEEIVEERQSKKESILNDDGASSPGHLPVAEIIPEVEQEEERITAPPSKE